MSGFDPTHHLHGVDDTEVPVNADACEEPDAAVQVQIEAEPGHHAECVSEDPFAFIEVINNQERQTKHV